MEMHLPVDLPGWNSNDDTIKIFDWDEKQWRKDHGYEARYRLIIVANFSLMAIGIAFTFWFGPISGKAGDANGLVTAAGCILSLFVPSFLTIIPF